MSHDVFISYSHKDKAIADAICTNLEVAKIRCWIAPRDIGPGEDWPTAISQALPQSRVMVMVFSSDSNNSDQVYRELFLAASNNVVIIPFRIEQVEPEPRKGYILAGMHWLDAMNPPTQEEINVLVKSVKSFLSTFAVIKPVQFTPLITPSQAEYLKPKPARQIPSWLWGLLIVILILAGGAAFFIFRGQTPKAVPAPSPVPSLAYSSLITTPEIPAATSTIFTAMPEIPGTTPTMDPNPERARAFGDPILAAVAKVKPYFEDDFSTVNPVWGLGGQNGYTSAIVDGVARIQINQGGGSNSISEFTYMVKRDFVLQMDARLVSGDTTSKIMVTFHTHPETQQLVLELYPAMQHWDISSSWLGLMQHGASDAISPIGGTTQITIVVRDARFAMYLNKTPISYVDDKNINFGLTSDSDNSRRIFIHCQSDAQAVCEYDNIKYWNLATIPGLP